MTEEAAPQGSTMDLWEHLMELRARLIRALIAMLISCILAGVFVKEIVTFLCQPLVTFSEMHPEKPVQIITEKLQAGFTTVISVSIFGGLVLAMPYVLWQVWLFVRPALRRPERGAATFLISFGTVLFLGGAAVGHYYAAPAALRFFFLLNDWLGIERTTGMPEYIKLVLTLMFGFGLGFQLPLVMLVLSWTGLARSSFFSSRRKYALVLAFVFGALLTPPDVPSQIIMAACLLILYELGILLAKLADRRKARVEEEEDAEDFQESEGEGGGRGN